MTVVVPILLALLAPLIWLSERGWMEQASDCLPLFAALPLFVFLGRPWTLHPPRRRPRAWVYVLAAALVVVGEPTGLIVLMAAGWTLALWEWLEPRLAVERVAVVRRLLVLPLLAFPWIIVDGQALGWLFRLSGAWIAARTFAVLGFDVVHSGTDLVIDGQPIAVAAACSGLNTLQALLVCGTFVAHGVLGRSPRFWWALPILVATAWLANTLRILMLCAAILIAGRDFAMGWFHDVGGLAVLLLMVVLCFLLLPLLRPRRGAGEPAPAAAATPVEPPPAAPAPATAPASAPAPVASPPPAAGWSPAERWSLAAQLAVIAVAAVIARNLATAWFREVSPFDRRAWIAALVWLLPVALHAWSAGARWRPGPLWASYAGLAVAVLGALGDNFPIGHLGLTLAIAALVPWQRWWAWWVAGAGSWWPATAVLILSKVGMPTAVAPWFRLAAAVAAVLPMAVIAWRHRTRGMLAVAESPVLAASPPRRRRALLWAALAGSVALVLLWRFVELPDAQDRVRRLPLNGPGFTGSEQPLAPVEAQIFRTAQAVKRRYLIDGRPCEIMVIDGTRNRHAVHDPMYCKLGAGWQVGGRRSVAVPGGEAELVTIVKGEIAIEQMHWYSDGRVRHGTPLRYWLQTTWRRLTLGAGGAEPVLVIVSPLSLRSPRWDELFRQLPALGEL